MEMRKRRRGDILLALIYLFTFPLFISAKPRPKPQSKEKVFADDAVQLDLRSAHDLESFIRWENIHEQNKLTHLMLAVRMHALANNSMADVQDLYHMAATKLKRALPNLKRVSLYGGHCFFPNEGSADDLRAEVRFVANSVESIWKAFRYIDVVVRPLSYDLIVVVDEKKVAEVDLPEYLRKTFGNQSAVTATPNDVGDYLTVVDDGNHNNLEIEIDVVGKAKAVRERTKLPAGRSNLTTALAEFYKLQGSRFKQQVFIPGKKLLYRTIHSPLYLEEFTDKVNIIPQMELEKLTFNLLLYPMANQSREEMREDYGRAVEALHSAAPNLNHVDIMGGHSLMRENGTATELIDELELLSDGVDAVADAFNSANLTLHSMIVQVFLIFPEEAFLDSNFTTTISELFANDTVVAAADSQRSRVIYRRRDAVEIRLELSATSDLGAVHNMSTLAEGYTDDFTAAAMLAGLDMSYIRGDAHLHDW